MINPPPRSPSLIPSPTISRAALAAQRGVRPVALMELLELDRSVIGAQRIDWSWNIAGPTATRREIRILLKCLEPGVVLSTLAEVLPVLFLPRVHQGLHPALRHECQFITGIEFQRALVCGPDHVANLIAAGALPVLRQRSHQSGPGSSPRIAFTSVRAFLEARRI